MKQTILTIVILIACPIALLAEEVGQINAEFDGEARQWFTVSIERDDKKALSASLRNLKRLPTLTLQGHTEPRYSSTDVLSITASWFGAYDAAKSPVSVEVIFMPKGMSNPFYTSDQVAEQPTLTVDNMEFDDSTGHAAGSFSAKVCLVSKLYETPDPDNCKSISGTFDTEIQVR